MFDKISSINGCANPPWNISLYSGRLVWRVGATEAKYGNLSRVKFSVSTWSVPAVAFRNANHSVGNSCFALKSRIRPVSFRDTKIEFAEILKTNTRRSNMCGRIGGEEFLLTHADANQARVVVDGIRETFQEHVFAFGDRHINVTASFGISGSSGKLVPDFSTLLNQADRAIYSAKNLGRNCVQIYED